MRKEEEISFLPSELWTQVLARLPVKDLLKFRCICKEWCSIIDSPDFVSLHLSLFKNNCDGCHLLLLERLTFENSEWMVRRTDTFRKAVDLPKLKFTRYSMRGYVNGLLLIHQVCSGGEIILCNPSVGKFMQLPHSRVLDMGFRRMAFVHVGLGCDFSNNDHKVVVIAHSWFTEDDTVPGIAVEVFSLNSGCWKSIVCGTQYPFGYPSYGHPCDQMFVKGAIYWKVLRVNVRCPKRKDYWILSFDVVGEMIGCIDLPANGDDGDQWVDFSLTVLDGSLAILDSFKEHCCIWELDKHGVDMSWTKRYTVDLQGPFNLLCLTKNHKLLFAREDVGVQSYDLKSGRTNKLAETYPQVACFSDSYVESLVLFKGVDGETM